MTRYGAMYGPDLTFLGVPPCDLSEPASFAGADVVIVGAPFDGGTSHRPGTRFGPSAMRQACYLAHDGSRPSLATRVDGLRDLRSDLAKQGVRLGLARVKTDLRIALERANLDELIGTEMMFPTLPVMEQKYLAWASEHPYPDMPTSAAPSTTAGPATSPSADPQRSV